MKNLLLGMLALLIVQAPFILALDCEDFTNENYEVCEEILDSDLEYEEKELLLHDLDTNSATDYRDFQERNSNNVAKEYTKELKIKTDKLKYFPDEVITLEVFPKNKKITITYGNIKKVVKGGATLIATNENKIIAQYNEYETEQLIFIQNKERFNTLVDFSMFGILNYVLYIVIKKYTGGLI